MKNKIVLIKRSKSKISPLGQDGIEALITRGVHLMNEGHCYGSNSPCSRNLGCHMVSSSHWEEAVHNIIIISFDELPLGESPLTQTIFCFSSLYDSNLPTSNMLERFFWGNGQLFDLKKLLGKPKQYYLDNFSNIKDATLALEKEFLPLILDFVGEQKLPLWQEVATEFKQLVNNFSPK